MLHLKISRNKDIIKTHPCFSLEAHHKFGRIHLPVAPVCNIQCKYCVRKYDCANESRPGITSKILTPDEAMERVGTLLERNENISVIGIAGPGEPLANDSTFEVLKLIHREFPEIILCVSTNGILLPDRVNDLMKFGVRSVTITINAVMPEVAEKIYSWAYYKGKRYTGREAAEFIVKNQARGLRNVIDAGLIVKVNTVYIPGINEAEIPLIAWLSGRRGVDIMNIIPLIPQAELSHLQRPTTEMIKKMREDCEEHLPQMTHCRQCRADAFGILGEDKDMELEILNARIGEEYCDVVN
ncbi:MAG: nitrogenase cofactor biosynthesis protein NifB [Nitrospirae bacterium]|nr:nitrogenase cofactor biosynthesis protein NifB [Nitrospirota bacterium]